MSYPTYIDTSEKMHIGDFVVISAVRNSKIYFVSSFVNDVKYFPTGILVSLISVEKKGASPVQIEIRPEFLEKTDINDYDLNNL